ncbi:MAG: hypothetical protein LBS24_02145 [Clostridiales Family XIII bacterium]|jgi:hypothetical protein|nr:hypothetical protein [Clostridiales Family XIII bacterium]
MLDEQACPKCPSGIEPGGGYEFVGNSDKLKGLLEEVFTDEFMRCNTNFENFEAFRYSGAVIINWDAEVLIYNRERLDSFVNESTSFSTWNEMIKSACDFAFLANAEEPEKSGLLLRHKSF